MSTGHGRSVDRCGPELDRDQEDRGPHFGIDDSLWEVLQYDVRDPKGDQLQGERDRVCLPIIRCERRSGADRRGTGSVGSGLPVGPVGSSVCLCPGISVSG